VERITERRHNLPGTVMRLPNGRVGAPTTTCNT
jgi:hypothetical protein